MSNPRVVSFHYALTDPNGNLIDSTEGGEPFTFMEGVGQMIPGLESQMGGLKKGDKKTLQVPHGQPTASATRASCSRSRATSFR